MIRADLHIHTALSPCASREMTPPAIAAAAVAAGLDMIAICDHNSADNALAVQQAAGSELAVLAGIEITTAEEVHVLGIFPDAEHACRCGRRVQRDLPAAPDGQDAAFGRQSLLDSAGREIGVEDRMLSARSALPLEAAVELIKRCGGLAIAAHVDRPSFSVISQLGLFPEQAGFDGIEVYGYQGADDSRWRAMGLPIVSSSDSHFLADIATRSTPLAARQADFAAIKHHFTPAGG